MNFCTRGLYNLIYLDLSYHFLLFIFFLSISTGMAGSTSGIIGGMDPLEYSSSSPYTIFFFQLIVIVTISQLLYIPLSKIKQPRVIAEVLTGILLSHTALGRIPNFTKYMFPPESIPGLTLVANIGICLLLFIVGCEVDVKFIKMHIVTALGVGLFNMAVPFGLGCACAIGLWKDYRENAEGLPIIKFTTFMVFIAVAMCITAFPVLVRILTELRLVKDRVGTVVLAAGITNDLLGWVLLALSITLANSSQSLVTLYIVLVAIGWCLFICFPIRILLNYLLKNIMKEFDDPNNPSRLATTIILLLMFSSAFFTDIIGVHPIFGAFIVGCIVPRENDYVIKLTSRIEDLVNILLVPVYFGIAGLNVDLGLLNKGLDWGWAFGLIGVAMVGKISGGLIAAKLRGLYWRESLTVGVLMSCKGIVEIVVLQVGLNARIITQKTYSMFIFMALITTFLTTPLTIYCYPDSYKEKVQLRLLEKQKLINAKKLKDENETEIETDDINNEVMDDNDSDDEYIDDEIYGTSINGKDIENFKLNKIILTVEDVESLSTDLLILDLLLENAKVPIHAINLKTLTERTADILHASMLYETSNDHDHDYNSLNSILSVFKIFCRYNKIPFTSEILYSLPENYAQTLFDNSTFCKNDLLILPITQKQYSFDKISTIIKSSKNFQFNKAIFINNTQEINENAINEVNKEEIAKSINNETMSFFSENTILNPSAFDVSSVTLYLNNSKLTKKDILGLKLLSILIKGKGLHKARIILDNITLESKINDDISQWIQENEKKYNNIEFSLINKTNQLMVTETGKSVIGSFIISDKTCENLDRLVIINVKEDESDETISELMKSHEKVILLF